MKLTMKFKCAVGLLALLIGSGCKTPCDCTTHSSRDALPALTQADVGLAAGHGPVAAWIVAGD